MPSGVAEPYPVRSGPRQSRASLPPSRRSSRTETLSRGQHSPASPVLRASPLPSRSKPALAGSRLARARHRQAFPGCLRSPWRAGWRRHPAGGDRSVVRSSNSIGVSSRWQPFPEWRRGGLRINLFKACSGFAHVTACTLAESTYAGLSGSLLFGPCAEALRPAHSPERSEAALSPASGQAKKRVDPARLGELIERFGYYACRGRQVFVGTQSPDFLDGAAPSEGCLLEKTDGFPTIRRAQGEDLPGSLLGEGERLGDLWRQRLFGDADRR